MQLNESKNGNSDITKNIRVNNPIVVNGKLTKVNILSAVNNRPDFIDNFFKFEKLGLPEMLFHIASFNQGKPTSNDNHTIEWNSELIDTFKYYDNRFNRILDSLESNFNKILPNIYPDADPYHLYVIMSHIITQNYDIAQGYDLTRRDSLIFRTSDDFINYYSNSWFKGRNPEYKEVYKKCEIVFGKTFKDFMKFTSSRIVKSKDYDKFTIGILINEEQTYKKLYVDMASAVANYLSKHGFNHKHLCKKFYDDYTQVLDSKHRDVTPQLIQEIVDTLESFKRHTMTSGIYYCLLTKLGLSRSASMDEVIEALKQSKELARQDYAFLDK